MESIPVRAQDIAAAILAEVDQGLVSKLYSQRVRALRTRRYHLGAGGFQSRVEVLYTLLGIELKIGRRRLLCPDRATADFLSVFARLGVDEIAVPYDITQVASLAEMLQTAWQRLLFAIESQTGTLSPRMRSRVRNLAFASERDAIVAAGAGPLRPEFDQSTRQRHRK